MTNDQRTVAVGAASGVAAMTLGVWALTHVLPAARIPDASAERLTYALRADVFAVVPFFLMIIAVGNSRFTSQAIDPTRHAESRTMEVDGRVVDNTLQQTFVFFVTTLAVSTIVPLTDLQVVWACAIVFVTSRIAFWIGYRIHPLYRAPGMAATSYMNLGLIVYVLFCAASG